MQETEIKYNIKYLPVATYRKLLNLSDIYKLQYCNFTAERLYYPLQASYK